MKAKQLDISLIRTDAWAGPMPDFVLKREDTIDLSGTPKDVFDRYSFIEGESHLLSLRNYGLDRRQFLYADPLPEKIPTMVRMFLNGRTPHVLHTLDDGAMVWRKRSAEWFVPPANIKRQHVYFMQIGNNGPIKIGIAENIASRLADLETGCPWPLKVIAHIPNGGMAVERKLHRRFSSFRMSGEWFSPSPELLSFIAKECQPWVK